MGGLKEPTGRGGSKTAAPPNVVWAALLRVDGRRWRNVLVSIASPVARARNPLEVPALLVPALPWHVSCFLAPVNEQQERPRLVHQRGLETVWQSCWWWRYSCSSWRPLLRTPSTRRWRHSWPPASALAAARAPGWRNTGLAALYGALQPFPDRVGCLYASTATGSVRSWSPAVGTASLRRDSQTRAAQSRVISVLPTNCPARNASEPKAIHKKIALSTRLPT